MLGFVLSAAVSLTTLQKSASQRAEEALQAGAIASQSGDLDAAEREYRLAARIQSGQPDALFNYALVLQQKGQSGDAERLYRRVLRIDLRFRPALLNLATLVARKDPRESIALLNTLLLLSPSDPRVHFNLGYVLLRTGREQEGLRELNRSVRMSPGFSERRDQAIAAIERRKEGSRRP